MNSYFDADGFIHDKPTIDGEPSSNNRLIYSAYYRVLGGIVAFTHKSVRETMRSGYYFTYDRLPNKSVPPFSKDELVGGFSLGYFTPYDYLSLRKVYWNFSNLEFKKGEKPNYLKAIKEFWKLRNKDRNEVWENKELYPNAYIINFTTPLSIRFYLKKLYRKSTTSLELFSFWSNVLFTLIFKSPSSTGNCSSINMTYLMLKKLRYDCIIKLFKRKIKKSFLFYFSEDHPIIQIINANSL